MTGPFIDLHLSFCRFSFLLKNLLNLLYLWRLHNHVLIAKGKANRNDNLLDITGDLEVTGMTGEPSIKKRLSVGSGVVPEAQIYRMLSSPAEPSCIDRKLGALVFSHGLEEVSHNRPRGLERIVVFKGDDLSHHRGHIIAISRFSDGSLNASRYYIRGSYYVIVTYGFMSQVASPSVLSNSLVLYNMLTGAACPEIGINVSAGDFFEVYLTMLILTIHEVGKVDEVLSLIGIVIGQDTVIHEFPSEGVGNYNDNSSVGCIVGRLGGAGL